MATCSNMIYGLECWQTVSIMAVIIILVVVPVISWIIHRRLKNRKMAKAPAPLMYITTVSAGRTSDIDIPHLPSPGEANFLPPSYEDLCNNADNKGYLTTSAITLNVDNDLPEYPAVSSHRSSMVLSTFYSDNHSARISSVSARSESGTDSDSDDAIEPPTAISPSTETGYDITTDRDSHGVFVA